MVAAAVSIGAAAAPLVVISKAILKERRASTLISRITRKFSPIISSSEIRHESLQHVVNTTPVEIPKRHSYMPKG